MDTAFEPPKIRAPEHAILMTSSTSDFRFHAKFAARILGGSNAVSSAQIACFVPEQWM